MKFLALKIACMILVPVLVLCFCGLFLLTIRARRGSRLYRLRVFVLGLIVTLWGGLQAGCDASPPGGESTCYAPVDLSEDREAPPDAADPPADPKADEFTLEATCYIPPDPNVDLEISPEEAEDEAEDEADSDDLDASSDEVADEEGSDGSDGDEEEVDGDEE